MTPSTLYRATSALNIQASGARRPRWPLLGKSGSPQFMAYAFDQDFQCALASVVTPPGLNTPSNLGTTFHGLYDGNAILTKISQPSNAGDGQVKFTASFARVPATWNDFQSMNVTFPGWIGYNTLSYLESGNTRTQKTSNVLVRIRHDYFVIDPAGILTGAGVLDSGGAAIRIVLSKGAIPDILRQQFFSKYYGVSVPYSDAKDLVPTAGLVDGSGNYYCPSVPSVSSYQGWCAEAAGLSGTWDDTHPPAWDGATDSIGFGQWGFRDSTLADYEGNIVDRQSFYVLAR